MFHVSLILDLTSPNHKRLEPSLLMSVVWAVTVRVRFGQNECDTLKIDMSGNGANTVMTAMPMHSHFFLYGLTNAAVVAT